MNLTKQEQRRELEALVARYKGEIKKLPMRTKSTYRWTKHYKLIRNS